MYLIGIVTILENKTKRISLRFASQALRNEEDKRNPRVAILHHQSLDSLPRCLFIVAELDPLRDDSYSKRNRSINEKMNCLLLRLSKDA